MSYKEPLSEPATVGQMSLSHKAVMAPLTRYRARNYVPCEESIEYYEQRASSPPGGLIISEATYITERAGDGAGTAPGIWNQAQIDQWKRITEVVHAQGTHIYLQLWALGWSADPTTLTEAGFDYVSASPGSYDTSNPSARALSVGEINQYVKDYVQAAHNAMEAGFDGVEIHSANSYLLHQFVCDLSNKRTDEYGGSIENRARFTLQVIDAVSEAIGSDKVGVRFSPWITYNGMGYKTTPKPQYSYIAKELERRINRLAYIHTIEPRVAVNHTATEYEGENEFFREAWKGKWLRCGCMAHDKQLLSNVLQDPHTLPVFGRFFISNPDLPRRLINGISLADYDRSTFMTGSRYAGYIDYPFAVKVSN